MTDKDEFCRCSCHEHGLTSRECPLCYFVDGNRELNERIGKHIAEYPEESVPDILRGWR